MTQAAGAQLKPGRIYRVTLERPARHSLPPIFVARFVETRPRYDFHNGHFVGWQAIFETQSPTEAHRRFGLPCESFSVEPFSDLARNQIWY